MPESKQQELGQKQEQTGQQQQQQVRQQEQQNPPGPPPPPSSGGPDEHPEVVGSAITRIVVPKNVSSLLSVTAVPAAALSYNGSLRDSLSIVAGCTPVDVIDAQEYLLHEAAVGRHDDV